MNRTRKLVISMMLACFALSVSAKEHMADHDKYRVVINHEEQYSIWVANRPVPEGWKATGFVGKRNEALDHIDEVWKQGPEQRREIALELYKELQAEQGKSR